MVLIFYNFYVKTSFRRFSRNIRNSGVINLGVNRSESNKDEIYVYTKCKLGI